MLTWVELLFFYGGNILVWLGIALLYVRYFHESDEAILGNAHDESSTERGADHG
ncbi:hypothetical protein Htur_4844 (plasmid) [Haloterrigena turkmenica DSM 5511]|uniref:Uncharacterized protein n=1 Tax=Haloterrigena turkmenica (strain ATCC 51198 / DSM 5511 / JCM 9101 / NCIMB 13204 / VKM B-1734 / 4k) TaxID=543526 RepID=D2S2K7_HALTV|nr:hypothetical protein Htur_4844 [Haloterrigena turkmenica DSM 5511]